MGTYLGLHYKSELFENLASQSTHHYYQYLQAYFVNSLIQQL